MDNNNFGDFYNITVSLGNNDDDKINAELLLLSINIHSATINLNDKNYCQ